jgi:hypothetical protein
MAQAEQDLGSRETVLKQKVDYYQNKRRHAEKPGNEIFTHDVSSLKA